MICTTCRRSECVCGPRRKTELEKLAEDEAMFEKVVQASPPNTVERAMYEADLWRVRAAITLERKKLHPNCPGCANGICDDCA